LIPHVGTRKIPRATKVISCEAVHQDKTFYSEDRRENITGLNYVHPAGSSFADPVGLIPVGVLLPLPVPGTNLTVLNCYWLRIVSNTGGGKMWETACYFVVTGQSTNRQRHKADGFDWWLRFATCRT
jgi:hypothetical protein